MARHLSRTKMRKPFSLYLDPETDLKLLRAKDRSGRTKSAEAQIRLLDHLLKYPDFYNSDMVEVIPNNVSEN